VEAASVPQSTPALRLGELLVQRGYATEEHVNQALELQPLLRKRLGEILVEKGLDDVPRHRGGARRPARPRLLEEVKRVTGDRRLS
jgi:hypothetical protein